MAKKYFWLKLKDDFFQDKRIKKLRRVAGGDTYTVIYLKMQLLSLKNEGLLFYEGVEETFYEELALEIDESEENVQFTIMFLQQNGLLEEVQENQFALIETMNSIGTESQSAERVRRHRELKKEQKELQCNKDVTACNTEKEKEKDIEIDNKNTSCPKFSTFDLAASEKLYELMKLNNDSVKKPNLESWAKEVRLMRERDSRTEEQIMYVIEWCQKDVFWKTNILSTKKLREKFDALVVKIKTEKERRLNNNGWNERPTNDFGFNKKLEDRVGF